VLEEFSVAIPMETPGRRPRDIRRHGSHSFPENTAIESSETGEIVESTGAGPLAVFVVTRADAAPRSAQGGSRGNNVALLSPA